MSGETPSPLVELIDEPGKSGKETPLVEFLGRKGKVLTGVDLQVIQLLVGGCVNEIDTRQGRQVDVQNMCRLLNINPNGTKDEIKRAYRAAIRRFHPDVLTREGVDQKDIRDLGWRMIQLKKRLGI